VSEQEVVRDWAISEVISDVADLARDPYLPAVRRRVLAGEKLLPGEWDLLETRLRVVRSPLLDGLLAVRPTWFRGELSLTTFGEMRIIAFQPFVEKAPSRRLEDYCAAEAAGRTSPTREFIRERMNAPVLAVASSLSGPYCLVDGYNRCCRALRDSRAGYFDGHPIRVNVCITSQIRRWQWIR
jgi:hypothetical protein